MAEPSGPWKWRDDPLFLAALNPVDPGRDEAFFSRSPVQARPFCPLVPLTMDATWEQTRGVWLLRLNGRLDISRSDTLESAIRTKLQDKLLPLVINLGRVSYISSSGVGALLGVYRFMSDNKKNLVLCEVSPAVQKLLDVVELGQLFKTALRESEAIQLALQEE